MFAVPGWSISADNLQAETPKQAGSGPSKSKKRKRHGEAENVTASNVADLWEKVIEGKTSTGRKVETKEAQRKRPAPAPVAARRAPGSGTAGLEERPKKKSKQHSPKKEAHAVKETPRDLSGSSERKTKPLVSRPQPSTPAAPPKLTPLQASMREKLVSARFRSLNETLYTSASNEAFKLFQEQPEMFNEYHEGFRRQVEVWPENPVDSFINDIKVRAKRIPPTGKLAGPELTANTAPLPRTSRTCRIADLGCGDARLAKTLLTEQKKLGLEILSYDLQSPSPLVTKADIANLPLADGSVDVAIFCLALMGANWLEFVEEAYRILRWKGELWIAEIKSRFGPGTGGTKGPVSHSVGNRKKAGSKKAKADPDEEAAAEAALAVEVDGVEDKRRGTDLSNFVEALRKRGFVLQGEPSQAIDMTNKMFVKMRFIKAAPLTKGKDLVSFKAPGGRKKFIEQHEPVDESSILKPCVYKIR